MSYLAQAVLVLAKQSWSSVAEKLILGLAESDNSHMAQSIFFVGAVDKN